jgi:predicted DCC family thiol-disulfide oxidoreductase YuxK
MDAADHPIVFFDGQCGLCNRTVDWILRNDTMHHFLFAPLQGETAGELFKGMAEDELYRSFWLKDEQGLHRKSTAMLRVYRKLGALGKFLSLGLVIPRPIRDWAYGFIAKNRYKIWGRTESCRIPTPAERAYFLP